MDEAIENFKKALSIKPSHAKAHNNFGNALREQDKINEALSAYKKAVVMAPDYHEAYNNIGNALKDQGKFKDALYAFKKAIKIKPDYSVAHRHISTLNIYTTDDPHFQAVKELCKKPNITDHDKCNLNFALAKMYDDIGNLSEAFKCLSVGNTLRKKILNTRSKKIKNFRNLIKTQPSLYK